MDETTKPVDQTDGSEDLEDGAYIPWVEPIPKRVQHARAVLRFAALAVLACAIGYGIVFAQNSGEFNWRAPEAARKPAPSSAGSQAAVSNRYDNGIREPGVYVNRRGESFVSEDGVHVDRSATQSGTESLPVFKRTDEGTWQRER